MDEYGHIDLSCIEWRQEHLAAETFSQMTTDPGGTSYLEQAVTIHEHWTSVRPLKMQQAWAEQGTSLRPPIILDRALLREPAAGLQVVEGRT